MHVFRSIGTGINKFSTVYLLSIKQKFNKRLHNYWFSIKVRLDKRKLTRNCFKHFTLHEYFKATWAFIKFLIFRSKLSDHFNLFQIFTLLFIFTSHLNIISPDIIFKVIKCVNLKMLKKSFPFIIKEDIMLHFPVYWNIIFVYGVVYF